VQLNERMKKEQVETLFTYQIEPVGFPKNLGATKGIVETPWLKIELTKSNAYRVTNFGQFLDIKRKGRVPGVSSCNGNMAQKSENKPQKIQDSDDDEEDKGNEKESE
jgi:hypothetical protein